MYNFLNRNLVFQLLFLFPLLGLSIFLVITRNLPFNFELSPFTSLLFSSPEASSVFVKILIIIILCATISLWTFILRRYDFFDTSSYYPSVFYIAILLLTGLLSNSSFPIGYLFIISVLLFINMDYTANRMNGKILFSGILIGLLLFVDLSAVFLLFFVIRSFSAHRFGKLKDVCILLFGFILPLIYFFSYYFLTDQFEVIVKTFSRFQLFGFIKSFPMLSPFEIIRLILLIIILFCFIILLRLQYTSKLIALRRRLVSIDAMTIALLLMMLFSGISYSESAIYLTTPFTAYFSLTTRERKHWIFNDVLILLTLILLWL